MTTAHPGLLGGAGAPGRGSKSFQRRMDRQIIRM